MLQTHLHSRRSTASSSPLVPFLESHGFHFNTPRWVNDARTWTISLSTDGVQPPPRTSPSSAPISWEPTAESGWTLKRGGDLTWFCFGTVSTTVLRWGYTSVNEEYLRVLRTFLIKQGQVEHSKIPRGRKMEDCLDVWTWWDSVLPLFRARFLAEQAEKV
ncbi:hypothetical protein GY45DRAFT_1329832, partial [Cubamyces sp. BRFM 1775]